MLEIKLGTPMTQESLPMCTFTSNSGDKDTTSPMMKCWGVDLGGMTDIAIVSWYNEDGILGSKRLPNSHDQSSVSRGIPWKPMKIQKVLTDGRSDAEPHHIEGKKSQNPKLRIGSKKRSNLVSSGYIPRDYDSRLMSEVLSRHFSITSDTIDLNLSRLYELEILSRSKKCGKPITNLFQKVLG
jgi:hypothetical protein